MAITNVNTYGDISPRSAAKIAKKMLERGQHLMVTERFGMFDPQPKKSTKTRTYRRYNSLPRATAPLAEAVPPSGQKVTYEDVTVTLEQYGDMIKFSDVVEATHEDPIVQEFSALCGEQAAETVEELRINVLKAGSNVFYANGVTSRASVNSPATRGDFRKIVRAFARNKGRVISRIVPASAMVSTEPVAAAYFAMCHTDLESDLRGISGFVPVEQYSNSAKALPEEIGKVENVRILCTAMFDAWAAAGAAGTTYLSSGAAVTSETACDVYPIIVVAANAYGIVPLQGSQAIHPFVIMPQHVQGSPMGEVGYVGWKTMQAAVILNQLWIARLECAATANPS